MVNYVIKRNGEYKLFHFYKIKDAVQKGFESQKKNLDNKVLEIIESKLGEKEVWSVEEIQDIIEKTLYSKGYFDVMRSFMLY
ncbi:MAG: ATP cone domain-containing protein, partial [Bacteroidetes bacterium]|nr:ATP cone domain-containing protein [Bacteroidota bacterium]